MATFKCYPKRPNANRSTINLLIRVGAGGKDQCCIPTGVSISEPAKNWDGDNQCVVRTYPGAADMNYRLMELVTFSKGLFNKAEHVLKVAPLVYVEQELRSKGIIKKGRKGEHSPKVDAPPPHTVPLVTRFDEFIRSRANSLAPATIKAYGTAFNYLKEFRRIQKQEFLPDDVDYKWIDEFRAYLHRHDLVDNYVRRILKDLKTFLYWCDKREYLTNRTYRDALILGNEKKGLHVAFTLDELDTIEALDLSKYPGTERARCLLFISCYTGLRLSDAHRFHRGLIEGDFARIQPQKTVDDIVCIPTHDRLMRALDMQESLGSLQMSSQRYNEHLKVICKLAGMTQQERVVRFKGSGREETFAPRWSRVSSHTARRTFITIMLRQRVPAQLIMKITGHKDIKSFQRYVHLSESDSIDAVRSVFTEKKLLRSGNQSKRDRAGLQHHGSRTTVRTSTSKALQKQKESAQ